MVKLTDDDLSVITTFSNSSSAECKTKCNNYRNYHCTFSASDSACVQYKRDIKDLPYEFSLIYAGNDTTSYVKTQFNEVVKTTIAVPDDAYNNSDLPCYRDPVSIKPPSQIISMGSPAYADTSTEVIAPDVTNTPYISPHQLQQLVDDIKEENTVDTKTLSSYKNKLISAEDNRPSAMVIGYAGAIFIGLFFGLILLLDIPKLIMDLTSLHRREREHITMDDEERILVKSTLRRRRPKLNNRRCSF
ncbi:uncharacterized protein [Argopecten irradians]|uniref:uncharacterized protein n=1 Tax=Argopecten irradians TaxID=31199 RepID=UPI003716CF9E